MCLLCGANVFFKTDIASEGAEKMVEIKQSPHDLTARLLWL